MEYEAEGARPRGKPKKTWREIVEKDCQAHKLNKEDDMDRKDGGSRQGMIDDHDRCECFFWYWLTQFVPDEVQRAVKWL